MSVVIPHPGNLLVNLSFIGQKPTGLATYGLNLIPHLSLPQVTLLSSCPLKGCNHHSHYPIPANLTPEQGKRGHFQRLWWTQTQLPRIYRQERSPLLFSLIPEAPLWAGCRSVVVVHDLIPLRFPNWKSPLTPYFRYYIPQVLRQAEHVICNSVATAKDVQHYFQVPADKLTPIPLAHDASHFRGLDLPDEPDELPYFFYVGRHDPYKNLHRLIQAFAICIQQGGEYGLRIAGSPDPRYTPTLHDQIEELGLSGRVQFLDYVPYDQLPVLLNRAIALVFPSLWEGFGFPVLEAMACGTPVITSNLSSLPEVAGDAALLVNPYEVEAIASAMKTIAQDEGMRSQLKQAGLARANQFSWVKTGALTSQVLAPYL